MNILLTWLIFMLLFLAIGYILGARNRSAARREDEASETPKAFGAETLAGDQRISWPIGGSRAAKLAAPFSALCADARDHNVGRRVAGRL